MKKYEEGVVSLASENMSLFFVLANFFRVCADLVRVWFWSSMLHKLISRALYFPSILRMSLMVGPERRWYDRVDSTVLLGALPFRSQTKEVRVCGCVWLLRGRSWTVICKLTPSSANVKVKFINLLDRLVYKHLCDTIFFFFASTPYSITLFLPPPPHIHTHTPIKSWVGPGTRLLEHTAHKKC